MILRFKFIKYGPVVYIGHLDVMRYFQKVIRRSGIDASYTGGFSPHLKLSFAQPLSVGVETKGDYFDLEMNSLPDMNSIVSLMNQQCVEGLEITQVTVLPENAVNGMSSVKAAKYILEFEDAFEADVKILEDFFSKETYEFDYVLKDKENHRDIMPDVYSHEIIDDSKLSVTVNCSSSGNLKPIVVYLALENFGFKGVLKNIVRVDLYTDADGALVPLGNIGEVYD